MTLRELWEDRGFSPTQVAAQAGITTTTLYKMNRKESVSSRTIASVCHVLNITRDQYRELTEEK